MMSRDPQSARERAELNFGKTQTQSLARNRIVEESEAIARERDAKTARLKEMRLQKEAEEMLAGTAPRTSKRTAKN
ncbi:hypothetical protein [Mesorhizobium sp. KR1-2]|uniref:hypothetical protein n=1 Tax=Mesorhizobium sp. KR1-2 TaxID=3156609 RepID=UPI0032B35115